jgi:plasmid maintenance system antidote protein VapI
MTERCQEMGKPRQPGIDRDWFLDRLRGRKISQRKLAQHLGLDPAAITLILQDRRKITSKEAHEVAGLLGVSVAEVLRRAGVPVSDDVRRVPISGTVGSKGVITHLPAKTHDMVVCPADVPNTGFALQVRVPSSHKDGWLYFVSGEQVAPETMLDKYVIAVTDDGRTHSCVIKRGYKSGTFNLLLNSNTTDILENEHIAWVSPVIWVRPL